MLGGVHMTWLPLLPLLLVGLLCWAVIVWKYRKDTRRNRYRSTLGRPYRDPRSSLEQFRRIVGGGL